MPTIETSRDIAADVETVYALARRVEDFPGYMPDVRSLKVLEESDDGRRTVTEWVGVVKEFNQTVHWVEEDLWDDTAHTCSFKQLKGDYSEYRGEWRFEVIAGGTRFLSSLYFEYNIPLIGPLIQGIIANLMRKNLENTVSAIGARAEAQTTVNQPTSDPARSGLVECVLTDACRCCEEMNSELMEACRCCE